MTHHRKLIRIGYPISIGFTAAPTGIDRVSACWGGGLYWREFSLWEYWDDDDDPLGLCCSVSTMDNGGGVAYSSWEEGHGSRH